MLYRLDETQWQFCHKEKPAEIIRVITPGFLNNRAADYALAKKASEFLSVIDSVGNFTTWDCFAKPGEILPPEVAKRWQIIDVTKKYWRELQDQSLVYKHDFTNPGVRVFEVRPDSYLDAISLYFQNWISSSPTPPSLRQGFSAPYPKGDGAAQFFERGSFADPFTQLATSALQTDETPFVPEYKIAGAYRFVLADDKLRLEPISESGDSEGVKAAISAYRDSLKRAFNWRLIRNSAVGSKADLHSYPEAFKTTSFDPGEDQYFGYLKESFGIDFDQMLKEGMPLLPDHVYKCNIAANLVEMSNAESLYARLDRCLKPALVGAQETHLGSAADLHAFLKEKGIDLHFSLKEIQGMYQSFARFSEKRTIRELNKYLASFEILPFLHPDGKGDDVRRLTPESFHRLMEILFADSGLMQDPREGRVESFFTGRKIVHLAICGYKTMGDGTVFDPCRNLAECLHIFPLLRSGNWKSYYEHLAQVLCKKALQSRFPSRNGEEEIEWRVGRIIPFSDEGKITRWYYVDGYLNDRTGDVNYVLIPASRGYLAEGIAAPREDVVHEKRAPLIKLYRSTASSKEAESSTASLLADLNPHQVGDLDFDRGDEYEQGYFQKSTMPLWVGYLIAGHAEKAAEEFLAIDPRKNPKKADAQGSEENLLRFMTWQKKNGAEENRAVYDSFKKRIGEDSLRKFFTQTSLGAEWASDNKISQDIHFVGHSLGAALSQEGFYHFGAREGRIPLVGCNFECFAFDPPGGVTDKEGELFLRFGREHKGLLQALGQKWGIHYQFEYQDFVPQGGPCWLGISEASEQDWDWLDLTGVLYQPMPSAKSKEITTMPTHGRRFHHIAQPDQPNEYKLVPLTARELYEFKNAWWLSSDLRQKFGFHITTPRLTEDLIRKPIGGTIGFSLLWIKKQFDAWKGDLPEGEKEDAAGVTFYNMRDGGDIGFVEESER